MSCAGRVSCQVLLLLPTLTPSNTSLGPPSTLYYVCAWAKLCMKSDLMIKWCLIPYFSSNRLISRPFPRLHPSTHTTAAFADIWFNLSVIFSITKYISSSTSGFRVSSLLIQRILITFDHMSVYHPYLHCPCLSLTHNSFICFRLQRQPHRLQLLSSNII